jgi:hypothetical protein
MATLKDAIDFARKNPNSDFAKELRRRIESGLVNEDARKEGSDLSVFGVKNTQPATEPETSLPEKVATNTANVVIGAGKGIASTFKNMASLGEKAVSSVLPSGVKKFLDIGGEKTVAEQIIPESATETSNAAQTVGKVGEQIGEMFIPTGWGKAVTAKLATIPELAKNAPLLAKISQQVMKTGVKGGVDAVEFGGKTFLQTGDAKQSVESGVIAGTMTPLASFLKLTGKGVAEGVIPTSAKEAKLIQTYEALGGIKPNTAAQTAFKKQIMGTEKIIGVEAKKKSNELWNDLISPALKRTKIVVDVPKFFDEAKQAIIKGNPELSRQKSLIEALNAIKQDYKGVSEISLEQLQKFKEGWAKFVPEKAYKGKPIAGAFNEVRDTLSDLSRQSIYHSLGDTVKEAYFDYGNLKALEELGQKAMTGGKLKGGAGSWISAIKDMALTPIGTIGGKIVYKIGDGIEVFGRQGAKTLRDLFNED